MVPKSVYMAVPLKLGVVGVAWKTEAEGDACHCLPPDSQEEPGNSKLSALMVGRGRAGSPYLEVTVEKSLAVITFY